MSLLKSDGQLIQDLDNPRYGTPQPLGTESESLKLGSTSKLVSRLSDEGLRALSFVILFLDAYSAKTLQTMKINSAEEGDDQFPPRVADDVHLFFRSSNI